jgi:hypothetical protein
MIDREAVAALLDRRLSKESLETMRQRIDANWRFAESIRQFREANPAAVSPWWGLA